MNDDSVSKPVRFTLREMREYFVDDLRTNACLRFQFGRPVPVRLFLEEGQDEVSYYRYFG